GAGESLVVVARFLALLELSRARAVALTQDEALGGLLASWTGGGADEGTRGRDEGKGTHRRIRRCGRGSRRRCWWWTSRRGSRRWPRRRRRPRTGRRRSCWPGATT